MPRKLLLAALLFGCLLLSGCDGDFLTDKQRLEGVNQAGEACGMVFLKTDLVPDMPNGAVMIFDADQTSTEITEVFFESNDFIFETMSQRKEINTKNLLFFACEQERALVIFNQFYSLAGDELIAPSGYPATHVGQKVDFAALPENIWRVYCLPDGYYFARAKSYIPEVTNLIAEDLLFLFTFQ